MEIYILDNFNRIGSVDKYEALLWNPAYNDVGSFELHCSIDFFLLLQTDRIVQNTEDDYHNGIIEYVEKAQDDNGVEKLIVKGRMLEAILERRVAFGAYTFESKQPAQIIAELITSNAINPTETSRKIAGLQIGTLANSDYGTVSYAGESEDLLEITKKLCQEAQLGFRVYIDENRIIVDIYKGTNRTEEDNIITEIETHNAINVLDYGHFENYLNGWTQIDGGANYQGQEILYAAENPRVFNKVKIKDRYPEYWETTGKFKEWIYFFREAGYIVKNLQLLKSHIYYIDISCHNPTDAVVSYGFKKDEDYTFNVGKNYDFERLNTLYVPESDGTYNFVMAYGELPEIEGLTVFTKYGGVIDLTATFGVGNEPNLDWCYKNIFYENGTWKYKIEITSFVDNPNDPLILSRDRGTLLDVDYVKSIVNECNVLYVKGDGINTIVQVGEASSKERKENSIDLSSIKREIDGIVIPEASYIAMLQTAAKAAMRQMVINEIIDGKYYLLSNKKYGQDFYIGDMVSCVDSIGFEATLRLSSVSQTWDINGYSLIVTLGDDVPNITDKMKLVSKGAI